VTVSRLTPSKAPAGVSSSFSLDKLPLLVEPERCKPSSSYWVKEAGWRRYLEGKVPQADELIKTDALWKMQERTGIALDGQRGAVKEGHLFTVQGVAFAKDVGFLLATSGVKVSSSHLRFGGDGRGAELTAEVDFASPLPDYKKMLRDKRCRVVLTSPGLFAHGWRLPGMAEDGAFELRGVKGTVCSAALSRSEVVSGWDLAKGCPKTALRSAGIGSVYWLENLEATPEALTELLQQGLWDEKVDLARQAEGFNRFQFAIYEGKK
ncbi:MAG: type III-B CRISPR module-associated Cmr3 family protein, partial [Gammaproteobacteria bacterium]|nr:type III-B CRISPR module-associated Cmr3 family protein [Gammaproteobacteria bacterium]